MPSRLMKLPQRSPSASLTLVVDPGTIFLHPSPDPAVIPTNDPILRGAVVIDLPKPRRIRSLSVKLVRFTNVCFPDFAYEYGREVQAQVFLSADKEDRLIDLAKGRHSFAFTLVVPSSAAPYERSQYGRVYYKLIATAKGDALIGSDLSDEQDMHIVVNPADDGETQDLDLRVEGHHPEIGPYGTIITSQHLTVGGFMHFDFFLASVPSETKLISVSAVVNSTYSITSLEYPKQIIVSNRKNLFVVDAARLPEYQTDYASNSTVSTRGALTLQMPSSNMDFDTSDEPAQSSPSIADAPMFDPIERFNTSLDASAATSTPVAPSIPEAGPSSYTSPQAGPSSFKAPHPATGRASRRFSLPTPMTRRPSFVIPGGGRGGPITARPTLPRTNPSDPSSPSSTTTTPQTSSRSRSRSRSQLPSFRRRTSTSQSPISPVRRHNGPLLNRIPQGKSYQLSHLAQLPGDEAIRPSTMAGTKTPIRVMHDVVLEVRFARPARSVLKAAAEALSGNGGEDVAGRGGAVGNEAGDVVEAGDDGDGEDDRVRVLRIERPIVISSCCCMLESVLVPTYSAVPEPSSLPMRHRSASSPGSGIAECICGRGGAAALGGSSSPLFVAERRALAARLRDSAEREASRRDYKAVYRPPGP